jgi:hypothetical protein
MLKEITAAFAQKKKTRFLPFILSHAITVVS